MAKRKPRWKSTPNLAAAFSVAQLAHNTQSRKNDTCDPYISHLMAVAALVIEHGGTESQAIVALLHDTIEDTNVKYEALRELFGSRIANGVRECSDTEVETGKDKGPYGPRKTAYLVHLASAHPSDLTFLVKLADKTHNCEATARVWSREKHKTVSEFWKPFNSGDSCQETWYRSLALALTHVAKKQQMNEQHQLLLNRFNTAVSTLFDGRKTEKCTRDHEHLPAIDTIKRLISAA